MKILLGHNHYQQPGGEDQVFADEAALLESHGHEVLRYTVHNDSVEGMNRLALATKTIWNRASAHEIGEITRRERPDVVHFTNTFPLISPAAYYAVKREDVPIVQSLHNFRLVCPGSMLYRNDEPCEACLGKAIPWPAVTHGCYRSSRLATSAVAAMTTFHRALGTWQTTVDRYIALSRFSIGKLVAGGLPADKMVVKPNFVAPDPGPGDGLGGYALFVGRLSPEKGLATLLDAWDLSKNLMPLKIVGDGPLAAMVRGRAAANPNIEWLGRRPTSEVLRIMSDAAYLVIPSQWYECCPKTLIESLAVGTPIVASRLGAMAEMIEHSVTGLHFTPGDAQDLAVQVLRFDAEPQLARTMRIAARRQYERHYTPERNYEMLMDIYRQLVPSLDDKQNQSIHHEAAVPVVV